MSEAALDISKVRLGDPDIIQALMAALTLAKTGKINAIAIITANGGGSNITIAGPNLAPLNIGAQQLQRMTLDAMFNPQQRGPGILVPRG